MKLSKSQMEVLTELATAETTLHCMRERLDLKYFFSRSMKTVRPATVHVLIDKGLVEKYDEFATLRCKVRLTDVGKKFWLEEIKNA